MGIQRYTESNMEGGGVAPSKGGEFVEYKDHVASHAFDETKERELFEAKFGGVVWNQLDGVYITHFLADRINFDYCNKWFGWKECAKSRSQQ